MSGRGHFVILHVILEDSLEISVMTDKKSPRHPFSMRLFGVVDIDKGILEGLGHADVDVAFVQFWSRV